MRWLLISVALLGCAACTGEVGTISVELTTAPASELLSQVQSARLTLTSTGTVVEDDRADGKLSLEIAVDAGNRVSALVFEGFDAGGDLIARGESPPVPLAPIDAVLRIYVAPPNSFQAAPVELPTARSQMAAIPLSLGALVAGGINGDGSTSEEVLIYNAYGHEFQLGADLPAPRSNVLAAPGQSGAVYLFGGFDSEAQARSTLWRFDTNIAPNGAYATVEVAAEFARAQGQLLQLPGFGRYLVTGGSLAELSGQTLEVSPFPDAPDVDGPGVTLVDGETLTTLITGDAAGESGATQLRNETFESLAGPTELLRHGHRLVKLADNSALIVSGADDLGPLASAVRYVLAESRFEVLDDFLATPRVDAAVAATRRHVVVAGGADAADQVLGDAELFSVPSLEPLGALPLLVPRRGASAIALENNQVLIVGGTDADGNATAVIELFTPGS